VCKAEIKPEQFYPLLSQEDFQQMREDTRRLRAENDQLRRRLANLEWQIVTNTWAGLELH